MTDSSIAAPRYFTGIRGPQGFFSCFSPSSDLEGIRRIYIIKGFPGWGKTALLSSILQRAADCGAAAEIFACPADPGTPDGLFFPEQGILFLAGTPPHLPDPELPMEKVHYLCLPGILDHPFLRSPSDETGDLWRSYQAASARTDQFLSAAQDVDNILFNCILSACSLEKIKKRAKGIIKREIPSRHGVSPGAVKNRFLNALTKDGLACLYGTADTQCKRIYSISDNFGLAHFLLSPIKEAAVKSGYETICCHSLLHQETGLAHLIIPELSLAFLTSNRQSSYERKPYRHIRLDALPDAKTLHSRRASIRLWQKTQDALLEEASTSFSEAAETYRELSKVYAAYADPAALASVSGSLCDALFGAAEK